MYLVPDATCIITVNNPLNYKLDNTMLRAVLQRASDRFVGEAKSVEIYPAERDGRGFLEWRLMVQYPTYSMTIGVVQRAPGAEVEFHS